MRACKTQWYFRFMPRGSSAWRDYCQSLRVTGAQAETSQPRSEELKRDCRCWSSLKSGSSAEEIQAANEVMLERQEAEFNTLKRLEGLASAAETVFVGAAAAKELDPNATADALNAENESAENAQVCMHS